jgi:hypothetical protein
MQMTTGSAQPNEARRMRISRDIPDHPFDDYWEVFVCKHQDARNVSVHCACVLMNWAGMLLLLVTFNPWWLCLMPASQVLGLLGHLAFERSHVDRQDALFSMRATRCLNRMCYLVLTRQYSAEVQRVRAELDRYLTMRTSTGTSVA